MRWIKAVAAEYFGQPDWMQRLDWAYRPWHNSRLVNGSIRSPKQRVGGFLSVLVYSSQVGADRSSLSKDWPFMPCIDLTCGRTYLFRRLCHRNLEPVTSAVGDMSIPRSWGRTETGYRQFTKRGPD